jgi:hypothetical protein
MDEVLRYLFDLQGYVILEGVLAAGEVAELNRLIDAQSLPAPSLESREARFGGFLAWGRPFSELLDHTAVMPVLRALLGDGFRLDHYYGIHLREGTGPLPLHGGNTPYDPPEYYHFRDGQMINGLTVVAWNLTDTGGAAGGFCCIPGSHKSNYPCPGAIRAAHIAAPCVVVPEAPAGSALLFTEALTHGTAPWTAPHQRRSLLYKYSPGQQSWSKTHLEPPPGAPLTPRQRLLFEPPYFHARPTLFPDAPTTGGDDYPTRG